LIEYKVSRLRLLSELNIADSLYKQNRSNIALLGFDSWNVDYYANHRIVELCVNCWIPLISKQAKTRLKFWNYPDLRYNSCCVPFREKIYIFASSLESYDFIRGRRNVAMLHIVEPGTICLSLNTGRYTRRIRPAQPDLLTTL
jgi:hypothetical protein